MKGFTNSVISSGSENMDFGLFSDDMTPMALHNTASDAHSFMSIDGNMNATASGSSELDVHNSDPDAHQNIIIDGNIIS